MNTQTTLLGILIFCMIAVTVKCEPKLTITQGGCRHVTTLICRSPDIVVGQPYQWFKWKPSKTTIYDNTQNGNLLDNKYTGTITNGRIELQILNTTEIDADNYTCSYNFTDSNAATLSSPCPPTLTVSSEGCGGVTTLSCTSSIINTGDEYQWHTHVPTKTPVYDHNQNNVLHGKYNGTSINGRLVLQIFNTNETDGNTFSCTHNFLESNHVTVDCTQTEVTPVSATGNNNSSGEIIRSSMWIFALVLTIATCSIFPYLLAT